MIIMTRILLVSIILSLFSCSGNPKKRLKQGLYETSDQSVVWVAIDKKMCFILATTRMFGVIKKHVNWEGREFNVYYILRCGKGQRVPILVYGEIGEGIKTAAYNNRPLNLEQGMFFEVKEGHCVRMTQAEKEKWGLLIGQF